MYVDKIEKRATDLRRHDGLDEDVRSEKGKSRHQNKNTTKTEMSNENIIVRKKGGLLALFWSSSAKLPLAPDSLRQENKWTELLSNTCECE